MCLCVFVCVCVRVSVGVRACMRALVSGRAVEKYAGTLCACVCVRIYMLGCVCVRACMWVCVCV